MTGGKNCSIKQPRTMDVDLDSSRTESERGDLDSSVPVACSSNSSGAEEDEAEGLSRPGEAGASSNHLTPDEGSEIGTGREQEVSVEIGETYLCQRTDKTWRE